MAYFGEEALLTFPDLPDAFQAAKTAEAPYPEDRFAGRGLVICAGGPRLFTCAWVLIGVLRKIGCTLPIEVWHLGPEELGPPMRALMAAKGVQTVDALQVARTHPTGALDGWELKTFALRNSRFEQVIMLDADNVPVRDPAFLFDEPAFVETGALFWPDIVWIATRNLIWKATGLEPWREPSFETGQLVIDKRRAWRGLALAHWMNARSDAFYGLLYGDKDTFLIAWLAVGAPFGLIPHPPFRMDGVLGQRAPDGSLQFQHRTSAKWSLAGENRVVDGFVGQADCLQALAELREIWDGVVFNPPQPSPRALAETARLIEQRLFRYVRLGETDRRLELLPDNRIGEGIARDAVNWHVEETAKGLTLVISSGGAPVARLQADADGVWRGADLVAQRIPVIFTPEAAGVTTPAPTATDEIDEGVLALLAAMQSLAWDEPVARDALGVARAILIATPRLRGRLQAFAEAEPEGSSVAQALRQALEEVSEAGRLTRRPDVLAFFSGMLTSWAYDAIP